MANLLIPTLASPYYKQRTRLDGVDYNLRFAWNERIARWHLDIYDDADGIICAGLKLITNVSLLRFYQWDPRMPPGDLRVMTLSPDESPPGLNELGEGLRCQLIYFPMTVL
jgi:hypothetical protein